MTYLNALEDELTAAGISAARRRRIVAEFADHLHEDPGAQLGAPAELARQFADELGTRLARTAAFRAFAALAFAGLGIAVMFLAVGRMRALTMSPQDQTPTPGWAAPVLMFSMLAAQVALAAGGAALLRAWRLRGRPVVSSLESTVLVRRAAVGTIAGVIALLALPTIALAFPHQAGSTWTTAAWALTGTAMLGLASAIPTLREGVRLRPAVDGAAGDLISDLGPWTPAWLTPSRIAGLVALMIVVVLGALGLVTDDPYDGIARGIADGIACLVGFAVLGRYLGLRTPVPTAR